MLSDILDDLTTRLSGIAGSTVVTGQREIAGHDSPPRFVWVVLGATGEGGERNKSIGAKATREIAIDAWRVACHCWGADFRTAEKLRAAAVTALRRASNGRRYLLRDTESLQPEFVTRGHALVLNLEIWEPLVEIALPTLDPNTYPTAHIDAVAIDASSALPGDGELTAGES